VHSAFIDFWTFPFLSSAGVFHSQKLHKYYLPSPFSLHGKEILEKGGFAQICSKFKKTSKNERLERFFFFFLNFDLFFMPCQTGE